MKRYERLHHPLNLKRNIEGTSSSDLDDVLKVKTALHGLGYYELPDYGMTTYPDQPLFKSIKKFQSANRLKKDGIMKPEGPTVNTLWKKVSEEVDRSRKEANDGQPTNKTGSCPKGYHETLERICLPGTEICWNRKKCVPNSSGGGTRG